MAYQGFGLDGVLTCLDCGTVVADGWQPEHTKFHLEFDRITEAAKAARIADMELLGATIRAIPLIVDG